MRRRCLPATLPDRDAAVDRIFECISDFERVSPEFDPYSSFIAGQQGRLPDDVRAIFRPGVIDRGRVDA
jgi:hypothetical protein